MREASLPPQTLSSCSSLASTESSVQVSVLPCPGILGAGMLSQTSRSILPSPGLFSAPSSFQPAFPSWQGTSLHLGTTLPPHLAQPLFFVCSRLPWSLLNSLFLPFPLSATSPACNYSNEAWKGGEKVLEVHWEETAWYSFCGWMQESWSKVYGKFKTGELQLGSWKREMTDIYWGLWAWEKEDSTYWEHLFTGLWEKERPFSTTQTGLSHAALYQVFQTRECSKLWIMRWFLM